LWQIQEIAVNTFENLKGKVIYGLPVLLVNPHCKKRKDDKNGKRI